MLDFLYKDERTTRSDVFAIIKIGKEEDGEGITNRNLQPSQTCSAVAVFITDEPVDIRGKEELLEELVSEVGLIKDASLDCVCLSFPFFSFIKNVMP